MADIVPPSEMADYAQACKPLSDAQLVELDRIRADVEGLIRKTLGYAPAQDTYTEFYPFDRLNEASDGDELNAGWADVDNGRAGIERGQVSRTMLNLKSVPVRSIASVYENLAAWDTGSPNGSWPEATRLAPADYRLQYREPGICETGVVFKTSGHWINRPGCVKITYTAGWTPDELTARLPQVKRAVKIATMYNLLGMLVQSGAVQFGGRNQTSFSVTDFSQSFSDLGATGWGGMNKQGTILPAEALGLLGTSVNLAEYL